MPEPKALTLADIMSHAVLAVSPAYSLQQGAQSMAEARISSLLIEEDGRLLGLITETDILNALHQQQPADTPIIKCTSRAPLTVPALTTLSAARELLAEHGNRHLVVVDTQGKAIGLVSESDFRMHLGSEFIGHLRSLENVMERAIPHLAPDAPLAEALRLMVTSRNDYIIVSQDGKPLGILTERDLPRILYRTSNPHALTVGEAMSSPLRGVKVSDSVIFALDLMTEFHLRHMAVLDEDGRVIGLVSQRRLFEQMASSQLEESLQRTTEERERLRLETHLQLALDAAGAGNWEYNHDTDRHTLSDSLFKLLGCSRQNAPRNQAEWLARIHPDDIRSLSAAVNACLMRFFMFNTG